MVPETIAVASHFGTPVALHELLLEEADDSLLDGDGSLGSLGLPEGAVVAFETRELSQV